MDLCPEGTLGSAMSRSVSVLAAVAPAHNDHRAPGEAEAAPVSLDGPMFGEVDRVSLRQFYGYRRRFGSFAAEDVKATGSRMSALPPESERWNGSNKIRTIRPFVDEGARNI